MNLNTVEELVEDIRQGKMVILMDDEDRENEGDLVIAAEQVRPEDINFMARYARGLICLTLTQERCRFLGLPPMVQANHTQFHTNFTVSIEAAEGVTTGISAADRAHTVRVAVGRNTKPHDIVQPGHVFPIAAQPGGVLSRAGHTEAGCDLARMAGFEPAAVIVEIMNEDGTMARRPDLEKFAQQHGLKIGTIADMIHYRALNEQTVVRQDEHDVDTEYGQFKLITFKDTLQGLKIGTIADMIHYRALNEQTVVRQDEHDVDTEYGQFKLITFKHTLQGQLHMAFVRGDLSQIDAPLVRVQAPDILRDTIGVRMPASQSWSVQRSLERIAQEDCGVVVILGGMGNEEI